MSNTTPTPASARESEAARELATDAFCIAMSWENFDGFAGPLVVKERDFIADRIAAAVSRARREALTEAAQVALANNPKDWSELDTTAERIAAAIERLRDGEGE